jgi:hypothetical protein
VTKSEKEDNDDALTEWSAARGVLARFDEDLHDLRKYGFSFVTGLLTVDALFATTDDNYKLAALVGTMALIVVLSVVDKNYRTFLEGATDRATLLENRSSPELTKTMTRIYEQKRVGTTFNLVYVGLTFVTFMLGVFVLPPRLSLTVNLGALAAALFLIWLVQTQLKTRPWVYFELDGFKYERPSEILIILTHIATAKEDPVILEKRVWAVHREDGSPVDGSNYQGYLEKPLEVPPNGDRRWSIPTEELADGLYRVVYEGPVYSRKGKLIRHVKDRWKNAPRFWVVKTTKRPVSSLKKLGDDPVRPVFSDEKLF